LSRSIYCPDTLQKLSALSSHERWLLFFEQLKNKRKKNSEKFSKKIKT
jgi:hypothetical protein